MLRKVRYMVTCSGARRSHGCACPQICAATCAMESAERLFDHVRCHERKGCTHVFILCTSSRYDQTSPPPPHEGVLPDDHRSCFGHMLLPSLLHYNCRPRYWCPQQNRHCVVFQRGALAGGPQSGHAMPMSSKPASKAPKRVPGGARMRRVHPTPSSLLDPPPSLELPPPNAA